MVAVGFLLIGFDIYLAFTHFGWMYRDVHVMAEGVFAIIDNIAFDAAQHTVVETKAFFGQGVFQPLKRVVAQAVRNPQDIRCVAVLDPAVRQPGQKLIGALYLAGRILIEYDIAMFFQFRRISHVGVAETISFSLQYLYSLEQV